MSIPPNVLAFILIKASKKMNGLVNVSHFHVNRLHRSTDVVGIQRRPAGSCPGSRTAPVSDWLYELGYADSLDCGGQELKPFGRFERTDGSELLVTDASWSQAASRPRRRRPVFHRSFPGSLYLAWRSESHRRHSGAPTLEGDSATSLCKSSNVRFRWASSLVIARRHCGDGTRFCQSASSHRSGNCPQRERAGRVKTAQRRRAVLTRPRAPGQSITGATRR